MNKTPRKARKSTPAAEDMTLNMATAAEIAPETIGDDALLASMLEEIIEPADDPLNDAGLVGGTDIELLAEAATPAAETSAEPVVDIDDDSAIEAALADIEAAEASNNASSVSAEPPAEAAPEAADKPKKEKKPAVPRVTYVGHKASEVLLARLGDKAGEMLLLEVSDVELEKEALEAKQSELLNLLNSRPGTGDGGSTQKKVAEKIVMLFNWMKAGGKLNEVMKIAFTTLAKDGEITSGDKGNLHKALLAKPYSVGTCRAQAGQMMSMLPMLKIANKTEKGKLVANPDSLILMKVKADLGLAS